MNPITKKITTHSRLLFMLSALLLVLVVAYMYLVSMTVMHVVIRQETDQAIKQLHSDIATLEAEYIAAQHTVSADIASLQGFVETGEKIFIKRTPSSLVLVDTIQ